mgnify:FL=1
MKKLTGLLLTVVVLSGCAPLILGAGAAGGYVAVQERSFKETGQDIVLKTKLVERIGRMDQEYFKDLSISVRHGEAFITGVVETEAEIQAIEQRARSVKGIRRVINALQLKPYPFKQYMADVATSTNLRSRLLFAEDVFTPNYEISLVKGEAFLFGWAYTPEEVDKVVHIARTSKGVDKVHNYLRVRENGREKLQELKRQRQKTEQEVFAVDEVE